MTNAMNGKLAYVVTTVGVVMGCSVFNGKSITEMIVKKMGLGTGYSSGANGFYIPGILAVLTLLGSYLFIKYVLKSTEARNYLVFCILLMMAMKIIGS